MKQKKLLNKIFRIMCNKIVVKSILSSLILIIISYFVNNSPLFTGESMLQYSIIQHFCNKWGIHKKIGYGDAVFYNVSYDKMLIPAVSDTKNQDTLGVNVITDRLKLFRFLKYLEKTDKYKYIILDLTFEKTESSIYDDSLFRQISLMRDIIVANHTEIVFADSNLISSEKTGLVTFLTTSATTNFGRFEYLQNNTNSLPLTVYEKIHPDKCMERTGWGYLSLYTIGRKLCQNCCFLTFDDSFVEQVIGKYNNIYYTQSNKYINMGKFISNPIYDDKLLLNLIAKNTKNKYVVIGDYIGDIHDTYMGPIPGSVIMMRALATLEEGGNLVYPFHVLLWFIVFFLINVAIYYDKPVSRLLPIIKTIKHKWFHFMCSLISFSFVLILISILEYICDYPVYSLMIPLLFFSVLKIITQYKKTS